MAWVLGEYGYLSTSQSKEQIMSSLCKLIAKYPEASTRYARIHNRENMVSRVLSM